MNEGVLRQPAPTKEDSPGNTAKVFSILAAGSPTGFELEQKTKRILSKKELRLFELLKKPETSRELHSSKELTLTIQKFAQTLFNAIEHPDRIDTNAHFSGHIKRALAYLLAIFPEALPARKDKKNGIKRSPFNNSITTINGNWKLCDAAEARTTEAIRTGTGILVNDDLFVKFEGKVVALCTKTFRSASGQVFLRGVFYAPETAMYPNIAKTFNAGQHTMIIEGGKWVLIRGASSYPLSEKLMSMIEDLKERRHGRTIETFTTPAERVVYAQ